MLPLRTRLEEAWEKATDFLEPDEFEVYNRSVHAALEDPETRPLLGKRSTATPEAVLREMQKQPYVSYVISLCEGPQQRAFDRAHVELEDAQDKYENAAGEAEWDWRVVCTLAAAVSFVLLVAGGPRVLFVAYLAAAICLLALHWSGTTVWRNLRQCLGTARLGTAWAVQRIEVGVRAVEWGEVLLEEGTRPTVAMLVRHMLGDDPDSVFIPGDYEGLRAPRAPGYLIENAAFDQLKRKLAHIEDGTIAVCGPRGVGKTTLLEQCVKQADFGVLAQAPATYTPHDFLLSLSVRLCEEYMRRAKYKVPEFTRLSTVRRLLRRARQRAGRLGRWSAFAVPATALVILGLSASVRSLYEQYATSAADFARTQTGIIHHHVTEIWQGYAVGASVTVTIAGIAWWKSRHDTWLPRLVGRIWAAGSHPVGILVAVVSGGSALVDPQIIQQVEYVPPDTMINVVMLGCIWLLCRMARDSGRTFTLGIWTISLDAVFRPAAAAAGIMFLLYLARNPQTNALLADTENPLRLAGIIAGLLMARAGGWRPRRAEPELVTRCRNHLYRLQTTQMTTNTLSPGASQILTLGSSHATSVSTIPPNYPELVEDFRDLLRRIAAKKADQKEVVVIAIDEVDRLGSDTQALAFLSEIKAILGVPHVYYLISVAEDVGAAFVRRGLPHRDVTDSSLDDIIYVQPSTLDESRTILAERAKQLTEPYVVLAHALSGGILRDLLRYALQIKEMQDKSRSFELTKISRDLILEELSETLAGFRTLLSKQQWARDTSAILTAFRTLCGYLPDPCPCTEPELRLALEEFAFHGAGDPSAAAIQPQLADDARQLIDEASAYTYFSLTLFDIFSNDGLDRRTQLAAEHGPDGHLSRLAEARQELVISPYSARTLIENIRKAWSLPLAPALNSRIPSQPPSCPIHSPQPQLFLFPDEPQGPNSPDGGPPWTA
ncbi:orc1/cdc6 family replication initiation protein [Streptomyces sp. GESEQ-4]|uniref:orc1/cdc6 family replication initiation protein n=1 Tax=Streptomyces sp. GESEQ-4 TaxID=2812655 RepID=UPI001B332F76|nr:orc1/cdc6 family replication initiation protein [Streptomyces sp. GESEQ-4]